MNLWNVKSEQGDLGAILLHNASYVDFNIISAASSIMIPMPYEKMPQVTELSRILQEGGIKVFELSKVVRGIVEEASLREREEILRTIWGRDPIRPRPEDLTWEHVIYGFPLEPAYDPVKDRVLLPNAFSQMGFRPYARDPSFGTPIGHVIGKMNEWRKREPSIVRFALQRDRELRKRVRIIYDHATDGKSSVSVGTMEGGDHAVCSEEILACGVIDAFAPEDTCFSQYVKNMFERDADGQLRYICAVMVPWVEGHYAQVHLDTVFNWVDEGKALVQPYWHDSELAGDLPPKRLLVRLIRDYGDKLMRDGGSGVLQSFMLPTNFERIGETHVYGRDRKGKPTRLRVERNFIDFLIKEELLDRDGIVLVGGRPEKENDMNHLIGAQRERSNLGANILALRPGVVVSYDKSPRTIGALKEHNVDVKLIRGVRGVEGGPRCFACPLQRDAV